MMLFICLRRLLSLAILLLGLINGSVADNDENCQHWADSGECDNNPGYMTTNCADACDKVAKAKLAEETELQAINSFYELDAKTWDGKKVPFETFRGKVVVIVNVASYCGYTDSHYKGLVQLHKAVHDQNVEILAFPCNQFGAQEPETCPKIKQFTKDNYGVEFQLMDKIDVNGPNASLVYKYLKNKAGPATITWNFATYFVISPNGEVKSHSGVEPMSLKDTVLNLIQTPDL